MSDTLSHIARKFSLDLTRHSPARPVEFQLTRHGGLTRLFAELGFRVGAEIGVEQGRFSAEICRDNPGVKLFCVDPWLAYTRYKDEVSQAKLDGFYQDAQTRLAPYNVRFIRATSMEAVKQFEPGTLDFVYIDGNHEYRYVVDDIDEWSRVVRPGGIVAGHDYRGFDRLRPDGTRKLPFHVVQAVNGFCDAWEIHPLFIMRGDKCPSFMWVKS